MWELLKYIWKKYVLRRKPEPKAITDGLIPFNLDEVKWVNGRFSYPPHRIEYTGPFSKWKITIELASLHWNKRSILWSFVDKTTDDWPIHPRKLNRAYVNGCLFAVTEKDGVWYGMIFEWIYKGCRAQRSGSIENGLDEELKNWEIPDEQMFYMGIMEKNWAVGPDAFVRTQMLPVQYPGTNG